MTEPVTVFETEPGVYAPGSEDVWDKIYAELERLGRALEGAR